MRVEHEGDPAAWLMGTLEAPSVQTPSAAAGVMQSLSESFSFFLFFLSLFVADNQKASLVSLSL